VTFQASITKDCEADEINVQQKRLESTLKIFILLITRKEQDISLFCYHCMLRCHIKDETRLTIAEGFYYKPVAHYEFFHCGSCSLTSERDTQQQKHGCTEQPEHG